MAKQSTFLMGHFEITDSLSIKEKLKRLGWKREEPDKRMNDLRNIFYEDFYNFCFSSKIGRGIVAYEKAIDKTIQIRPAKRNVIPIKIIGIKVFLLPFNMIMFYIEIEQSEVVINDICFTNRCLRNIRKYKDLMDSWMRLAIRPLIDLYEEFNNKKGVGSRVDLVGRGNRLKTFQIIQLQNDEEHVLTDDMRKEQLYRLGTLTYYAGQDETSEMSVTPQHLNFIMEQNSIYVQKGWSALALLDTFTVVFYCDDVDSYMQEFRSYCRTIYVHALFQKYYLFQLNQKHYEIQKKEITMTSYIKSLFPLGNSSIDLLAHDMRTFETKCSFNNIAYIYLPIMVHNYVSKGLQIEGEKQSIYNVVRAEKEEMEDISNKSINVILLALSFFSLISAILDGCVLINSILPFGQWFSSESVGFALFSLLFICILMCVILWFVIWGRRRSKRNQGSLIKPKLQNE